jgi:hypothetical protein
MMCAHSTPLPADAPAVQHAPDNILDGGPAILEAVLYLLGTPLALAGIVVCIGPFWDWLAVWPLTQDSPLVSTVMPLFKWLWLIIALSVIAAFAYVYLVVIRKIRYNRLMGGLE